MCDSDDDVVIVGETRAAAEDPTSADDRAAKRPRGQDLAPDLCNNDAPTIPRPSRLVTHVNYACFALRNYSSDW